MDILMLSRKGMSQRKIAKKLGLSRNTVKKYLENPEFPESRKGSRKRKSLLDPYQENLKRWLEEDPDYTAAWIYDRLTTMGFSGSYEIVKRKVCEIKAARQKIAYMRFETEPGYQGQVDFGEFQVERADGSVKKLAGLIFSEVVSTERGKETRLSLTEKGRDYINNTEDSRRVGGKWHRSAVQRVAAHYEATGYLVRVEYRDVDVYAERGREKLAIEVESLSGGKDLIQAVWNIQKALKISDRVESVVRDKASAEKLAAALKRAPIVKENLEKIQIRIIDSY